MDNVPSVQVISNELIRNLGLTMAAVVVVTLILISDLVTVFWVFTCIAFTLIDLLGLMYYWGLTVEIASSIIVILAAGLAIDYAAHIGHTFTTVRGSKSSNFLCFYFDLMNHVPVVPPPPFINLNNKTESVQNPSEKNAKNRAQIPQIRSLLERKKISS